MKGSDNQEKLVYQIIEDAGNKGKHVQEQAGKKPSSLGPDIGTEILASQGMDQSGEYAAICVKRGKKCKKCVCVCVMYIGLKDTQE